MYGLYNRVSTCFRYWLKWKIVFIWKKKNKKPKKHHWSLPRFLLNSFWVMKENKGRKLKMQMLLQEADWICISNTLGPRLLIVVLVDERLRRCSEIGETLPENVQGKPSTPFCLLRSCFLWISLLIFRCWHEFEFSVEMVALNKTVC